MDGGNEMRVSGSQREGALYLAEQWPRSQVLLRSHGDETPVQTRMQRGQRDMLTSTQQLLQFVQGEEMRHCMCEEVENTCASIHAFA